MPRFVILTHDFPTLHWDLMLENQASLRTWRLARPADSGGAIPTEPLPDHRLAYLDYEGPVGGRRGTVACWDRGEYETAAEREDCVEVELRGARLAGRARLQKLAESDGWRFYFTASPPDPS
jgi:hypothetical protein